MGGLFLAQINTPKQENILPGSPKIGLLQTIYELVCNKTLLYKVINKGKKAHGCKNVRLVGEVCWESDTLCSSFNFLFV